MEKFDAEHLALRLTAKIIDAKPDVIFSDNRQTSAAKAKHLSDFISALAKNLEADLSVGVVKID